MGHRWGTAPGKWNLKLEDPATGEPIDPLLTPARPAPGRRPLVEFEQYDAGTVALRGVPVRPAEERRRPASVRVTTVFDLLMARYGVARAASRASTPAATTTPTSPTRPPGRRSGPASTGRPSSASRASGRSTAETTGGKCCIIIGAGINHWYHNNLMYRAGMAALMLTGCVGKNGGGLNHYVGQEKLAPVAPWSAIAFARDWVSPPRLQNAPSWHYVHSDQWRYEAEFTEYHPVPGDASLAKGHTIDLQVKAVRSGWLPFYPQFDRLEPRGREGGARRRGEDRGRGRRPRGRAHREAAS